MDILSPIILLAILIFSAILHEIAHGFVAERLGDPTARLAGRLTLDPRKHIDPMMSIAFPLILLLSGSPIIFGAAKPVPVDPFNLRDGRKDLGLVSLAGPLTNIVLAIIASFAIRIIANLDGNEITIFLRFIFAAFMQLNILLAIFNLLPIPPLDGSKIFALVLPEKTANSYLSLGSIGFLILLFLLFFPIGGFSLMDFIYTLVSFSQSLLLP